MSQTHTRTALAKVAGNVVSATSHPQMFAANPGLRALAAQRGGQLVLDDEAMSAFAPLAGTTTGASPGGWSDPSPAADLPGDPDAFMDSYFASKRDAAERMAAARARPRR